MSTYRHVSFGAQQSVIVLVHLQHAESASIELLVRSEQLYREAPPEAKHTDSGQWSLKRDNPLQKDKLPADSLSSLGNKGFQLTRYSTSVMVTLTGWSSTEEWLHNNRVRV